MKLQDITFKNLNNKFKTKYGNVGSKIISTLIMISIIIGIILLLMFSITLTIGPIVYVALPNDIKENLPQWLDILCWVMIIKN